MDDLFTHAALCPSLLYGISFLLRALVANPPLSPVYSMTNASPPTSTPTLTSFPRKRESSITVPGYSPSHSTHPLTADLRAPLVAALSAQPPYPRFPSMAITAKIKCVKLIIQRPPKLPAIRQHPPGSAQKVELPTKATPPTPSLLS